MTVFCSPTQSCLSAGPLAYHVIQLSKQYRLRFIPLIAKYLLKTCWSAGSLCPSSLRYVFNIDPLRILETLLWGEGGVICEHPFSDTNCNWCCSCSPTPGGGKKGAAITVTEESCWLPRSDTEQALLATTNPPTELTFQ